MDAGQTAPGQGTERLDSESRRKAIEGRARAEAAVRAELNRTERIAQRLPALWAKAGTGRRLIAKLAGSHLGGLLAGDRAVRHEEDDSPPARQAAELRRRRFRLERRARVLEHGLGGLRAPRQRPSDRARGGAVGAGAARAQAAFFCIRIAGRDWETARLGGDAALAQSLTRALEERGERALVRLTGEPGRAAEVELTLRGRAVGEPEPSGLNLLWLISHPDEVEEAELERYDRVLVASRRHATQLAQRIQVPVEHLPQFTDPAVFYPEPDSTRAHELLFVGNWRGEFRRIVWDALETGRPPALYGRGWDLLAPEHAVAEHVPHDELRTLYSSCDILLCDHWEDMRKRGFVSNRVFDALACGAFVLADDNPGIAEELPSAAETYASRNELGAKLERYLADPVARQRVADRGRSLVVAEHTAERRAGRLLTIAGEALSGGDRPADGASAAAAGARDGRAGPA